MKKNAPTDSEEPPGKNPEEPRKHPGGRTPVWNDDFPALVEMYQMELKEGETLTVPVIAEKLGVSETKIYEWLRQGRTAAEGDEQFVEFLQACTRTRKIRLAKCLAKRFLRAMGFSHYVTKHGKDGEPFDDEIFYPPDVGAINAEISCLGGPEVNPKVRHEVTGADGGPIKQEVKNFNPGEFTEETAREFIKAREEEKAAGKCATDKS